MNGGMNKNITYSSIEFFDGIVFYQKILSNCRKRNPSVRPIIVRCRYYFAPPAIIYDNIYLYIFHIIMVGVISSLIMGWFAGL